MAIFLWVTGNVFIVTSMTSNHCFNVDMSRFSTVNVWCAICATMTATFHYAIMAMTDDPTFRILLKYADWVITAPVVRLQLCAILRIHDRKVICTSIFCTMAMLALGLCGELVQPIDTKIMMGLWSCMISEYSTYILERHYRAIHFHHLYVYNKNLFRLYGLAYLVGVLPFAKAPDLVAALHGVGDVLVKGSLMAFALIEH